MPSSRVKSMTKAEFNKLSNKQIANLSNDDASYLMSKFMKGFAGGDESDISMRRKGGMAEKAKVGKYAYGGMSKKAKVGKYGHGGMSMAGVSSAGKRKGHTDMRKGGMFKK
jgi:DNA invertase Pin-like site-specific DNA recombinase